MSADGFLARYWQKDRLFMPKAMSGDLPELSADELAWLATLEDVESRLIFTATRRGETVYRVEDGPFDEKSLAALPPQSWTLLIQDVEKHLPELRRYLHEARFIPDWRIDDLMVSYAAPGGGVGPHRDNYDVFLCQGTGRREWRIAAPDASLIDIERGGLSLLEPFDDDSPIAAGHGDVLYLPPGMAHWGIAREPCMTYSIGMRAPAWAEFGAAIAAVQDGAGPGNHETGHGYYGDSDLRSAEAVPGLISSRALERARSQLAPLVNIDDAGLARAFGRTVTEVKAWLNPEPPEASALIDLLKSPSREADIRVHGMARLAFCTFGRQNLIFVNGFDRMASPTQVDSFRQLCATRLMPAEQFRLASKKVDLAEMIRWLISKATFDLETERENTAH